MTNKNENKPGYKKTKVGWIPDEWNIRKINDIAFVDKNSLSSKTLDDFKFNYITLGDLEKGKLSESLSIETFVNAPSRARRIVKDGDVLLATVRPNLQGFGIIHKSNNFIASTGFAVLTMKDNSDAEFIYQYLYSGHIQKQLFALLVGSNYPAINSSDVKKLKLLFPKFSEQKKIAEILSTWDRAIEKTEKLIEKCELRKKGLMQRLLHQLSVNREQLSVNTEKWETVRIGDVITEYARKSTKNDEYEVFTSARTGLMKQSEYYGKNRLTSRDSTGFNIIPPDYITYRSRSDDGRFTFNINGFSDTGLVSKYYPVFRAKNENNKFLVSFFNFYSLYFSRYSVGTSQKVLSLKDLKSIKIPFPPIEEQKKIAKILDTADQEVNQLKSKLEALKEQKKGLMQKLLTGEVRTVVSEQ